MPSYARFVSPILVLAGVLLPASVAGAANFVVNNSADPTNTNGQCAAGLTCSLREAVNASNANGTGLDTITFTVTTANITNTSGIGNNSPTINGAVTIDGGGTVTIQRTTSLGSSLAFTTGGLPGDFAGTVKNLTLQGSAAAGGSNVNVSGGGATQKYALTLDHVTSQGNTVNGSGGGASAGGDGATLNVVDSTVAGNAAPGNRGGGILVSSDAVLNVTRSTIANNTAAIGGGIGEDNFPGVVTITNSTFSGNNVTAGGVGASLYDFGSDALNLSYNTITGSTTGNAAVEITPNSGTSAKLKGNIFAGNTIPDCINAGNTPQSQGFNFLKDTGANACSMVALANDHFGTALTLGALASNGGPTQTHALPSGSAAINAGGLGGCTTTTAAALGQDQRNVTRPQGSACDSGAFEFQAPANTVAPAITGTPATGQVLTCSQGTWSGGTPQTFAFEWRRDGVPIPTATNSTYTVTTADEGHALTCRVTATNSAGSAAADSNAANVAVPGGGGGGDGGGADDGGGGGGGTTDTTPPAGTLDGKSKQDVDKLALTVGSNEAGSASGQASVSVPGGKKPVTSKTATASIPAGGGAKLKFKFKKSSLKKIKKAIAKGKKPKAKITVDVTDGAGNKTTLKKTVKLKD